jgi:hypothetical protein
LLRAGLGEFTADKVLDILKIAEVHGYRLTRVKLGQKPEP